MHFAMYRQPYNYPPLSYLVPKGHRHWSLMTEVSSNFIGESRRAVRAVVGPKNTNIGDNLGSMSVVITPIK